MASLHEYLEGVMKVPLSLLTSEGFVECPSRFSQQVDIPEFEDFFIHKKITGIVNPETLDDMLRSMGISHVEFHETLGLEQPPCLNYTTTIHCLLGQTCLDRAIATLGSQFECTVQVFCIRPVSQRYTDGEIYQQVSRHMGTSRLGLADLWLEHLQEGKRKHLASLLGHPQIMEAMGTVLPFAGLWDEFLLGNWAKHLAAHCDELISNYWNHISRTWTAIFKQLEHLRHLIDIQTVERLRYKAPAWSTLDRDNIEEGFKDRKLFPHVKKELDRVTLKRNILSLDCIIPSIRTFDENMRYLTIPAKIIERLVEVKPMRKRMQKRLAATGQATESLFENLKKDWKPLGRFCEVAEGQFCKTRGQNSPELAFLQLFLIAWRNFPRLSTETPLQDIRGIGIIAFVDSEEETRLCRAAYVLGFSNAKIKGKLDSDVGTKSSYVRHTKTRTSEWRGGKPTIKTQRSLRKSTFYPQLFRQYKLRKNPETICIQADIIKAFFGTWVASNFQTSDTDNPHNPPQDFAKIAGSRSKSTDSATPEPQNIDATEKHNLTSDSLLTSSASITSPSPSIHNSTNIPLPENWRTVPKPPPGSWPSPPPSPPPKSPKEPSLHGKSSEQQQGSINHNINLPLQNNRRTLPDPPPSPSPPPPPPPPPKSPKEPSLHGKSSEQQQGSINHNINLPLQNNRRTLPDPPPSPSSPPPPPPKSPRQQEDPVDPISESESVIYPDLPKASGISSRTPPKPHSHLSDASGSPKSVIYPDLPEAPSISSRTPPKPSSNLSEASSSPKSVVYPDLPKASGISSRTPPKPHSHLSEASNSPKSVAPEVPELSSSSQSEDLDRYLRPTSGLFPVDTTSGIEIEPRIPQHTSTQTPGIPTTENISTDIPGISIPQDAPPDMAGIPDPQDTPITDMPTPQGAPTDMPGIPDPQDTPMTDMPAPQGAPTDMPGIPDPQDTPMTDMPTPQGAPTDIPGIPTTDGVSLGSPGSLSGHKRYWELDVLDSYQPEAKIPMNELPRREPQYYISPYLLDRYRLRPRSRDLHGPTRRAQNDAAMLRTAMWLLSRKDSPWSTPSPTGYHGCTLPTDEMDVDYWGGPDTTAENTNDVSGELDRGRSVPSDRMDVGHRGGPDIAAGDNFDLPDRPDLGRSPPSNAMDAESDL